MALVLTECFELRKLLRLQSLAARNFEPQESCGFSVATVETPYSWLTQPRKSEPTTSGSNFNLSGPVATNSTLISGFGAGASIDPTASTYSANLTSIL
jgi:hypothetical protein